MRIADIRFVALVSSLLAMLVLQARGMEATETRTAAGAAGSEVRTLAIAPGAVGGDVLEAVGAVLGALGDRIGRPVRLVSPSSAEAFQACAASGAYDLVMDVEQRAPPPGYVPIAREKLGTRGLVVVRRDSRMFTLGDLARGNVALSVGGGYAATVFLREEYARTVDQPGAIYDSVFQAAIVAGTGTQRSFNLLPDRIREQLRVIHQSSDAVRLVIHARAALASRKGTALAQEIAGLARTIPDLLVTARLSGFEPVAGAVSAGETGSAKAGTRSRPDPDAVTAACVTA